MRGDDRAGFLETAKLQRDRGADDDLLPLLAYGESAHPFEPIISRPIREFAADDFEFALEWFVDVRTNGASRAMS